MSPESTQSEERADKLAGEEAMLARYTLHMALLEKDKELGGQNHNGLQDLQLYRDNTWVSGISTCSTVSLQ